MRKLPIIYLFTLLFILCGCTNTQESSFAISAEITNITQKDVDDIGFPVEISEEYKLFKFRLVVPDAKNKSVEVPDIGDELSGLFVFGRSFDDNDSSKTYAKYEAKYIIKTDNVDNVKEALKNVEVIITDKNNNETQEKYVLGDILK